jgi:hypothetical protein
VQVLEDSDATLRGAIDSLVKLIDSLAAHKSDLSSPFAGRAVVVLAGPDDPQSLDPNVSTL